MNRAEIADKKLVYAAYEARKRAYAPYSNFTVGAAILTENEKTFRGANIENASFGLTICAERVAVASAVAAGEQKFTAIAIFADKLTTPCGACRQFLYEFSPNIKVILCGKDGKTKTTNLKKLLPKAFGKNNI